MQIKFQLGDTESDRENYVLLTEHLKSQLIFSSLYKVTQKKSLNFVIMNSPVR